MSQYGQVKMVHFHLPSEQQRVEFEIFSTATIDEVLRTALAKLSLLKPIDLDPHHYEVYVAKKNGQAKLDYPSYLGSQEVFKTGNTGFALVHVADQEPSLKVTSNHISLEEKFS